MNGFAYRGFMLDSVRHFMPTADIRKLIAAARICGMNRMHWHLTDDQGWRIEIRKYPQLTDTGAVRGRSFFGGTDGTANNCGYYTRDDVREIVRFAGENGMEVIPEIEMPGHASALLAACPEAGCRRTAYGRDGQEKAGTPWKYAVEVSGGIFPNLICAGRPEVLRLVKDILDEVLELFPSRMIHIGGDEALKIHWRRCPDCRRRIREEGLSGEDALQRELVLEIGAWLAERGRETIVWNDVLAGGTLPPYFIVQQWQEGEETTRRFMAEGGRVICSDTRALYLDYPYGTTDVRNIWRFPRVPEWAKGFEDRLIGLECPLWTERVASLERASFLLFPRLAAAGLKAGRAEDMPWEAFRAEVRETENRIEETGLRGAPEEYWDMPEDRAAADRQEERDRIYSPEALPYEKKEEELVRLERAERLMERIGIPEAFARRAGDWMLARNGGTEPEAAEDGEDVLIRQMTEAAESRAYGAWKRIPEDVFLATMRAYTRFIGEHRRSCGCDGFDRGSWTVRQAGCRLFRVGELEYELAEEDGQRAVSLHIPSDARLEAELLNDSVARAREFLAAYFPEWRDLPMVCESWLLSPALKELLPPESRILRFQAAFDLVGENPEDSSALEWVFRVAQGQRAALKTEDLPEETSLQRSMKAMILRGRMPGNARGRLARAFR